MTRCRSFVLAVVCGLAVLPFHAEAGDNPDIPYAKLSEWMPKLVELRPRFVALQSSLCVDAEASAEALAASEILALIDELRIVSKEAEGAPSWLLTYEEGLDEDDFYSEAERERFRAGMDVARVLAPQIEGLGSSTKRARSAVRKAKDAASAATACERLGELRTKLEGIEPGLFATATPLGRDARSGKVGTDATKLSTEEHEKRYGCPPCPCSADGNCAPCPPCQRGDTKKVEF